MPTYRVETVERWPRRVLYTIEGTDMEAAINLVKHHQAEPTEDRHLDNESDQIIEFQLVELIDDEPTPKQPPTPRQELRRMAAELPLSEAQRLMSVIQKFLWWDKANDTWNRDLRPSLDTLDFIADMLDRAGLRPVELLDRNT
jgi:hypothetical protein